jgi:uncharacterized protein YfaS (alpha-2-macroglobulin family)
MKHFIGWLLALMLLALVPQTHLSQAQDDTNPPNVASVLQVVDTSPLAGEPLGLYDSVFIYFDRELDCTSVEGAITMDNGITGIAFCTNPSTVQFAPDGANGQTVYERNTLYTLTIDTSIRGADGAQLLEPVTIARTTGGTYTVGEVFPRGEQVPVDSAITAVFTRPMVPLTLASDPDANLPDPLTFSPEITGTGEWLNTSIYVFTPDTPLDGGTTYTVLVDDALEAQDDSVLSEPYSWVFRTVSPTVDFITPSDASEDILLDDTVQMTFNMPMDTASVESAFSLTPSNNAQAPVAGTFTWNEDNTGVRFTPDENIAIETGYTIRIGQGAVSANGSAPLVGTTRWTFTTVPYPAILRTDPENGTAFASPYSGFTIYFSTRMDIDTLADKIMITPAPAREPEFYYRDWNDSYRVSFQPEPSTEYSISIASGMADIYGNTIVTPYDFAYTTDAFSADIFLKTPGNVGFYSAYREPTQLFLLHRNIEQIDLSLYSVPALDFMQRINDDSYDPGWEYRPTPSNIMRDWSIQPENVPNQATYELLEFDNQMLGGTADVTCAGSLPSRLKIGDTAIVIADPNPVRARSEAPAGDIVELLYKDYSLPIIGGPVCTSETLLWWQVELRDGTPAWVAESVDGEYLLDVRFSAQTTAVPVTTSEGDALAPGIYFLSVSSPQFDADSYRNHRHFMVVGTANLTVKTARSRTLIWATDINTGQPLTNVPITLYDEFNNVIGQGNSDANGFLVLQTPPVDNLYDKRFALLQTPEHFGVGFSEWTNGIEPYSFGNNYDFYPDEWESYVYTDRPIYRPGQPVYFRAVVRAKDDVQYSVPQGEQFYAVIYDDQREIVYDEILTPTQFGTISGEFTLGDEASLGYYYVEIGRDLGEARRDLGGLSFSVAEYRLPEFQVNVTPTEPEVVQGDTINVDVASTYFFGGAVTNADVEYDVLARPYGFRYQGDGYYSFRYDDADAGSSYYYGGSYGDLIASGSLRSDATGNALIELSAELDDPRQSASYTIEAVVSDESGQPVAGRTEVIVHQGLVYAGIRPLSYVGQVGEEGGFEIITVDWDSQPVANQDITVEILERRWSSVQEQDSSGRTTWTWEVEEIPVTDATLASDDDGLARFAFTPEQGGVYKAIVTTFDSEGNEIKASTTMWVSGRSYIAWRQQNSNRIDLVADADEYSVGETAEILITSPFQGTAEALITVERGDVLSYERVTMESNSLVYNLPIVGEHAPNIFVSVLIVKGVDENNPVAGFRMGYVQLNVDTEQRELNIDITANTERAQPQETVTYTVTTTDYDGRPIPAEVGVAVTDLASLSIASPNSGDILTAFFGQQALAIRTALPLTINTDQLTQETIDTLKGGGGGGGGGLEALVEIRGEFIDTPYWNGAVVTDANGVAMFDVRLPDNLTTWRLDARAVGQGLDNNLVVGQDTFDLLSTKPLIIRPVTPRFFVVDDRVVLSAVVNNNTSQDQEVTVTLQASGVQVDGDLAQTVTIPADGRARVEWNAIVLDVPLAQMAFAAQAGEFSDGSISPVSLDDDGNLPIYRYEVPETVGTAGVLRTTDTRLESIVLPPRFDITRGDLTVKLETSLASATLNGLDYLRNYPHQCIEQTVSRFLPNIMTYRALDSLGLADPALRDQLDDAVFFALQKLFAEQKSDGGWGWFVRDRSNALTTAYALIGLHEARQSGFAISDEVIQNAQGFLRSQYIAPSNDIARWQMNRHAFVLYAMARSGAPDVSRLTVLYDHRVNMDLYAKALLTEAFIYAGVPSDDNRLETLTTELVNAASLSATGVHWEDQGRDYYNWSSDLRTSSLVLSALIKAMPDSELLPNAVRYLMVQRTADAWETTQETAWAVMALTDWMQVSGELNPDYNYSVTLNDQLLASDSATRADVFDVETLRVDVSELLQDRANTLLFERTGTDAGALYYTAHLTAYLPVPEVEPLDRGIIVQRRYVNLDDPEGGSIDTARVGDVVQVRLTVIAPNSLHYVVIEDPLPAGAEAINPRLETSQQIGTRPGLDSANPLSRGWGWWYFSNIEFRDEAVRLYSTYLPAGTYEYVYTMRAGIAGTYNVIPATGQEFYFPEVYGRSAGTTFTILPEQE